MNARAIARLRRTARWPLAGDQLISSGLAHDNLPPGSRLELGSAVIGSGRAAHRVRPVRAALCVEAMKFVNSPLDGSFICAASTPVIRAGAVRVGDRVEDLSERGMR